MEMENEKLVIDTINVLANKLGTTGTHLWEVLVRQAPISCAINLSIFIIFLLLGTLGWIMGLKLFDAANKMKNSETKEILHGTSIGIIFLVFIISMFIIFRSFNITLWVSGFFNPEYWALHQVISMFE